MVGVGGSSPLVPTKIFPDKVKILAAKENQVVFGRPFLCLENSFRAGSLSGLGCFKSVCH